MVTILENKYLSKSGVIVLPDTSLQQEDGIWKEIGEISP
jgi:hypothetical protein